MITLTREEAQQVLDALENIAADLTKTTWGAYELQKQLIETFRARLAQPEKEWVGLTDEEIRNIATHGRTDFSRPPYEEYYIAIEQALKEKNT